MTEVFSGDILNFSQITLNLWICKFVNIVKFSQDIVYILITYIFKKKKKETTWISDLVLTISKVYQ